MCNTMDNMMDYLCIPGATRLGIKENSVIHGASRLGITYHVWL